MNRRRIGRHHRRERCDRTRLAIFTERGLVCAGWQNADPGWRDMPVSEWMTRDPYAIAPDVGWDEAVS